MHAVQDSDKAGSSHFIGLESPVIAWRSPPSICHLVSFYARLCYAVHIIETFHGRDSIPDDSTAERHSGACQTNPIRAVTEEGWRAREPGLNYKPMCLPFYHLVVQIRSGRKLFPSTYTP
jgi:hypothetical protein